MSKHNFGPNACVKNALYDAGVEAEGLPNHAVNLRAMPAIAEHYGLEHHGKGPVKLQADEPVVVNYMNTEGGGHTVYHERADQIVPGATVFSILSGFKK